MSIASKSKFAAPLYQPYLRSDSLHSPPQVLGSFCVYGVKLRNIHYPARALKTLPLQEAHNPSRGTPQVCNDGCGAWTCVSRVQGPLRLTCRKVHHSRRRYPRYIQTKAHRGHTIQHKTIPKFHVTKNIKYRVAPNSGCVHTVK